MKFQNIVFATFCFLLFVNAPSYGQDSAPPEILGSLLYYEGNVEIKSDTAWIPVSINLKVHRDQIIRTGPQASVEIRWKNGVKSAIGPESVQNTTELYNSLDVNVAQKSQSLWDDFKNLFVSKADKNQQEEGGIRRNKAEVEPEATPNELYWKKLETVDFNAAVEAYQKENYLKAIQLLHTYLNQNPDPEKAAYARFAIGHSYVVLNNIEMAIVEFNKLLLQYPQSEIASKAKAVLNTIES